MIVEIENLIKSFGSNMVLENITARIEEKDRIGLIGSNGAGKSTLLNIINKELEYETGTVIYGTGKNFGFLKQNSGLNAENTIYHEMRSTFKHLDDIADRIKGLEQDIPKRDTDSDEYKKDTLEYSSLQNQYELGEGYQISAKIGTVLNGMGFGETDPNTKVEVLSGGEKTRLALCKLLLESPDLLILDEPTNHLDFPTLTWLEEYLAGYKGALLIVSHDRFFLDKLCTTIWEVEHQNLSIYKGNYTSFKTQKEERYIKQQKEHKHQQEEIANLKDFIQRNLARASTTKRAQSRQKTLDRMEVINYPKQPPKPPKFSFKPKRNSVNDVLAIENLKLSIGENPRKKLFENLNFELKRGEKIAIIGHNGVGKTSLLKVLLKKVVADSGEIEWGRNVDLGYFEQDDSELHYEKTALNEIWDEYPRENEVTLRNMLGSMGIVSESVYKTVGTLSGGERARIKFAKLMLKNANVIIMDEPTNHLDLAAKETLDKALVEYEGTLLAISHDRYLLNKFPDKILELTPKGGEIYVGKYDDYLERKAKLKEKNIEVKILKEEPLQAKKQYRTKEDRRKDVERKTRISFLEEEIEKLEAEIERLNGEIIQPDIAADYVVLDEKCGILEKNKVKLDDYLDQWSALAE